MSRDSLQLQCTCNISTTNTNAHADNPCHLWKCISLCQVGKGKSTLTVSTPDATVDASHHITQQQLQTVYTDRNKTTVTKHLEYIRNRGGNLFTVRNLLCHNITEYNGFYSLLTRRVAPLASGVDVS